MAYTLTVYKNIRDIKDSWIKLSEKCPSATPFQSYEVMELADRYFFPYYIKDRSHSEFATISSSDGNICFIMPLTIRHDKRTESFGNVNGFNYGSFLYSENCDIDKCLRLLKSKYGNIHLYNFTQTAINEIITPPPNLK